MADYYDDSAPSEAQAGGQDGPSDSDTGPTSPSQTTLIPKSMCPGMHVGDSVTLKIDKELEDQYLVSYPMGNESDKEEQSESPQESGSETPDDEMME